MKIRSGFVSNSSSSSFAIFGISESTSSLAEMLVDNKVVPIEEGETRDDAVERIEDSYEVRELIEEKGLSVYDDESGELSVGIDFASLGEDETKRQFRERVAAKLKEVFGKDFDVKHLTGEYPC